MWKVGDVEPVRIVGAEGEPYRFNVTTEDGKQARCFFCLCIPSPCQGGGNTSGIGSAECNFGSSLRRISGVPTGRASASAAAGAGVGAGVGAGSVALSQTFVLGGQTVVLGAKHAVARMSLPRGRFQRALWARGDAAVRGGRGLDKMREPRLVSPRSLRPQPSR